MFKTNTMNVSNKKKSFFVKSGFSLIELIVVIAIVSILSGIVYASFGGARAAARDDVRKSDLKQLQLAVETYRAQNGQYPAAGCGTATNSFTAVDCEDYILNLVPDFISKLPKDPSGVSYQYRTDGTSYKVLTQEVEIKDFSITADEYQSGGAMRNSFYMEEFARCPRADINSNNPCRTSPPPTHVVRDTYAVYGGPGSTMW